MQGPEVSDKKDDMLPRYPRKYFAAPVYFALKMSEIESMLLEDSMTIYIGLFTEATGTDWRSNKTSPVWKRILGKIGASKDLEQVLE